MKLVTLILSIIFLTGCASYQEGNSAYVIKGNHPKNTPITAYIDYDFSTEYYTLLQFSFGNYNPDWQRIERATLDFNNKDLNKKAKFVIGADLTAWAESIKHKRAVDQHNRAVLLGSLAIAGAAVTATGKNSSTQLTGAAIYASSLGAMGFNTFMDSKSDLNRSKLVPPGHLYQSFAIPAGLVTKKWDLLEMKQENIPNDIYLNVTYKNKDQVRYKMRITTKYLID
jgi:hypothetical protein